jgi:hypothetical protein
MQLVEQGKLDLEADINTYLDFQIPDTFPEPIRLKHLLSQTSGFEDRLFEGFAATTDDLVPTPEWVPAHVPARVRSPGQIAAYSNYGSLLGAYIVERVSGMSYVEYIEKNMLVPLGMEHSTFRQPIPPELAMHKSKAYTYVDGQFQVAPDFAYCQPAVVAVGCMNTTVTDMARFMIAHLQDGRYSDETITDARILEEATAQQMHQTSFTHDPRLNGWAHGFMEFSRNGQWVIGRDGDTAVTHHLMMLLPDQNLGLFLSYNSAESIKLTYKHFPGAFFDHYFPIPESAPRQQLADFADRAGKYTGSYRQTLTNFTTVESVSQLFTTLEVSVADDGTLLVPNPFGEQRFVEVEPLVFREVDGQDMLIFREDDQGRITHGYLNSLVITAVEKLAWYQSPGIHQALLLICNLVFLTTLIAALVSTIQIRRGRGEAQVGRARLARWLAGISSGLFLLFTIGLFLILMSDPFVFAYGNVLTLRILLLLPLLGVLLVIGTSIFAVQAWIGVGAPQRRPYWGFAARAHYTLVAIAAVAFVWFLNYWNLLGWNF